MPLHAVSLHPLSMLQFAMVATVCMAAQSTVVDAAAREGPAALGGSVEPQPATVKASTRRLVFTCIAPSLVTFSDRPCGPAAAVRELQLRAAIKPEQAIEQAGRTPTVMPEAPRASARDRTPVDASLDVAPATPNDAAATCQRLGAALATLDARMRTGYSAREAGRLWDRWRDAKARLREADC
jgi:hypothetical protein